MVHEWRCGPWLGAPVWVAPLDKAVKDVPGLFGLAPHTRYTRARCGPPFRFRSTPPARRGEKGVTWGSNTVALLDLKLRLKMNPRIYAFVAQNVPILEEFVTEKRC